MSGAVKKVHDAVVEALSPHDRVVLAVSGGIDSMVMLDAAASVVRAGGSLRVATFDHGTGGAAARGARLVVRRAGELGLEITTGKARTRVATEAGWRQQRWEFLRSVARETGARIATAHTLTDQIETVFIRILRDSGPRGLAGLDAPSDVLRPLLSLTRADVLAYAAARGVKHVEDPSNISDRHLRNRVRHDLLPAILAVRPAFCDEIGELAARAALWRRAVASVVDDFDLRTHSDGAIYVARAALEGYDAAELAILWPEIAARAGATMDRRGTHRVAAFTTGGATGRSIQLSGGVEVVRTREHFVIRRSKA